MNFLKAEIERKRKEMEQKELIGPERKYFKRSELLKKEEEEFRQRINLNKSSVNEMASDECFDSQPSSSNTGEEKILPRKEVIRRLRDRGQPILLFGESEVDAFHRLKQLEVAEPENIRGFRNDFQEAMEKVDQEYLNELLKSKDSDKDKDKRNAYDVKYEHMNTTIEDLRTLAIDLGRWKDDKSHDCKTICTFLKFLLELWGRQLNERNEEEKISTQGKNESAIYTQTLAYLKPLFKQLKNNKVADDILKHLMNIAKYMLERDYVKASDCYLQMAIGNAPWPIGVTMVGIHARTGREKIFAQNIAHVLNDETQRKYIQGLKRLMTRCQRFFPTDPSKCVEYNA
ncbi:pre-mRNA processing factor 18 [Brevipalpus obovatus]|uniref:pre-mRNA processing factor 18 n=1 Tax=Brevipalpus obovatus TaxID=246614 RepID=UPI003D9F51C2